MLYVDQSTVEAEMETERRAKQNSEPSSFTKSAYIYTKRDKILFQNTQSNFRKTTEIMHNVPKIKEQTTTSC